MTELVLLVVVFILLLCVWLLISNRFPTPTFNYYQPSFLKPEAKKQWKEIDDSLNQANTYKSNYYYSATIKGTPSVINKAIKEFFDSTPEKQSHLFNTLMDEIHPHCKKINALINLYKGSIDVPNISYKRVGEFNTLLVKVYTNSVENSQKIIESIPKELIPEDVFLEAHKYEPKIT